MTNHQFVQPAVRPNIIQPHCNNFTPAAKDTVSRLRNSTGIKVMELDRPALEQYAVNNPDSLRLFRKYYGDNNLQDWRGRCDGLINDVRDFVRDGLINTVETIWNEAHQTESDNLAEHTRVTVLSADYIRERLPGVKVAGFNFSVGNPPSLYRDWEIACQAFPHLDYLSLHEYVWPDFDTDPARPRPRTTDGRSAGYYWLRYRLVYQWAKQNGIDVPPLLLTEFGLDRGLVDPHYGGYRDRPISAADYAGILTPVVEDMSQDPFLIAVFLYCCGVNDEHWRAYDVAGKQSIIDFFNMAIPAPVTYSEHMADDTPVIHHPAPPAIPKGGPMNEYIQWKTDPANQHDPNNGEAWLQAFIEKREDSAGVARGTFGIADAIAGGFPPELVPKPTPPPVPKTTPHTSTVLKKEIPNRSAMIERKAMELAVDAACFRAVLSVESGGQPFDHETGKTIVRFELPLFLNALQYHHSDKTRREVSEIFRMVPGLPGWHDQAQEIRNTNGRWIKLQKGGQDLRWWALNLAASFSRIDAFDNTSMGSCQLMGFHHDKIGYSSSELMLKTFGEAEIVQLNGLVDFLAADPDLHSAMKRKDAGAFAEIYNGKPNRRPYENRLYKAGWPVG